MPKPIFLRDKNGHIVKTIRPTPRPKKSTGRPVGFNASRDGFITAPPIKPVAPIPADHIHSSRQTFTVDESLPSDEIAKRRAQFDMIQGWNKQRLAESLQAYKEYRDVAKRYSNAITSGENEPLNPEAAELAPLVSQAYSKLASFKLAEEHINQMMDRLAYENYLQDNADRVKKYQGESDVLHQRLEEAIRELDSLDDGDEESDARVVYDAAKQRRKEASEQLYALKQVNALADLDFALNSFETESDQFISDLNDGGETSEDEAKTMSQEFWKVEKEYELASEDVLSLHSDQEYLAGVIKSRKDRRKRILSVLEDNFKRLDATLMKYSLNSELAESEQTYQISKAYEVAKADLNEYRTR